MLKLTTLTPVDHPEFDGHEAILQAIDPDCGLHALIAVHSTVLGPSLGGCRIRPYASEGEALTDVLRLSRGMTYKSAIAGLPLGGGKAVIIANPKTDKTDDLFSAFGDAVQSLQGAYITAEDVGSNEADMIRIAKRTQYVSGLPVADGQAGGNPSPVTAYGVFCGIKAAISYKFDRADLAGIRVAVQGMGSVGYSLAEQLHAVGADLVVTDVDGDALARAVHQMPERLRVVAPDEIYDQDVDVFAPCALGAVINDQTIPRLKACIVAGAANNQLLTQAHDIALRAAGILYAPDYVINSGGVTAVGYEYFRAQGQNPFEHQMTPHDLTLHVERIGATLLDIFGQADERGIGTGAAADELARRIVAAV